MPKRIIFIILGCTLIVLQACFSVKPAATGSAGSAYESFFVGEEGVQYFIKPLVFKASKSNNEIHTDFTFRYKDSIRQDDSVTVNYSIYSSEIVNDLSYLAFNSGDKKISTTQTKRLFAEKRNKQFVSRFTSRIALSDMIVALRNDEVVFYTHHTNNSIHEYKPTRKTRRALERLNNNLFVVFE